MINNDSAYIITGAPGSGKTSIINALEFRGLKIFNEPARAIIAEQRSIDGQGVYDRDPSLFKELMLSRSIYQYLQAKETGGTFIFDRGIPDMLAYSQCFNLPLGAEQKASTVYRYNPVVFFAPSWKAIFSNDEDRKLSFSQAQEFGDNLKFAYQSQGYRLIELPLVSPEERATFIQAHIE
ncbi:MAG: AAA family ATPase [Proteobacteria bacterium]|nr:AAA family ATPase [Pseudomonadota bacterium]